MQSYLTQTKKKKCNLFKQNSVILILLERWPGGGGGELRCNPGRLNPRNGKMNILNTKLVSVLKILDLLSQK
jgi:hypothetical protein